ncbi:hypothetical protein KM427_15740 [Nocardioides sp. LMS-CY]|uniref:RCC1 domain-containing protein n=1 Tax=Nocardioides sp. (strain LMS-CY) TaxID=2840457 RepID=UPI001C0004F2|nr:RCC1 domain-containing protein [Nocardioides sp. LMS-CY]QWF20433.1 hypothetical protein KM427_15740 [Nocardioides sp. LMS-CY]
MPHIGLGLLGVTGAATLLLALSGGLPTTGASFTAQAVVGAAQEAHAAEVGALGDPSASRTAAGVATVGWDTPTQRNDVAPAYTVRRTVEAATAEIDPTLTTSDGRTGFTDDLTRAADFRYRDVTRVSAGAFNVCAIADGAAYCWGRNVYGQIGDGTTTSRNVPTPVSTSGVLAGKTVTDISVGLAQTCAVADGRAYCWGWGGGLGDGGTTTSSVPVAVSTDGVLAGKTVTDISTGYNFTCAVADGRAYCWGDNGNGKLGNGGSTASYVPVAVSTSGALAGKTVTAVAAGGGIACALAAGRAYCWGYDGDGAVGDGEGVSTSSVPVAVRTDGALAGTTVTRVTAGNGHACAVASGQAYCWGRGARGQLGDGTSTDQYVPVAVSTDDALAGRTVTDIDGGDLGTCAVASGAAYCWGSVELSARSSVPVALDTTGVLHGTTATAISLGPGSGCVSAGVVACWGDNGEGQLGDGSSVRRSYEPVLAGDEGHGLTEPFCEPDWLLDATRCAPGPDVSVSYRIDYAKRGWSPLAAMDLTAEWSAS